MVAQYGFNTNWEGEKLTSDAIIRDGGLNEFLFCLPEEELPVGLLMQDRALSLHLFVPSAWWCDEIPVGNCQRSCVL